MAPAPLGFCGNVKDRLTYMGEAEVDVAGEVAWDLVTGDRVGEPGREAGRDGGRE